MIVYVESNFLLELARQQEQAPAAEEILRLAEASQISVALPVFAVCEPFSTISRYGSERARFVESMQRELRELGRTRTHRSLAAVLQPVGQTLLDLQRTEMDELEGSVARTLRIGSIIPLTSSTFEEARRTEVRYGLSPQDAIIYASVLQDLRDRNSQEPKCFVSRNSRDFDDPAIHAELSASDCRFIPSFNDALGYIRSVIRS